MRLGAVAVVKNEADIIEVFVRHHLALLDELRIVDNDSTDGTYEILLQLQAEGLAVRLGRDSRTDHPQEQVVSALLSDWTEPVDWVFCLDADEFIAAASGDELRAALAPLDQSKVHTIPWRFFVPTTSDDVSEPNALRRITHCRVAPVDHELAKVMVPGRFLGQPDLRVRAGNHYVAQTDGVVLPLIPLTEPALAHFPVRSAAQIAAKAVIGQWAIEARATRDAGEGSHWADLKAQVLAGDDLPMARLTHLAYNYAASASRPVVAPEEFDLVREPVPSPVGALRYTPEPPDGVDLTPMVEYADAHFRVEADTALAAPGADVLTTLTGVVVCPPARAAQSPVADGLRTYGEWRAGELALLADRVFAGDTAIIFGGGLGLEAIALGRRVGSTGRVRVYHPDDRLTHYVVASAVLNGQPQVSVLPMPAHAEAPGGRGLRSQRIRRRLRLAGKDADRDTTHEPHPSLVVVLPDGPRPGDVLPGFLTVPHDRRPEFYIAEPHTHIAALRVWAQENGYRGCWFVARPVRGRTFSGAEAPSDVPPGSGVLLVPTSADAPPGLLPIADAGDAVAAWQRQGAADSEPPVRWAAAGRGLDPRWR